MAQIIWTEPALADLNDIAEYIAVDNSAAARKLVATILDKTESLGKFPKSGRIPPELKGSRYREIIVGPCRIFYRTGKTKVYILHVMRAERLLRQYMIEARARNTD